MDEIAAATGRDPLELRLALLGAPRRGIAAVLALAAQSKRMGDAYRPPDMLAASPLDAGFGSYVAQIAEVSVAAKAGSSFTELVCAVDCGIVVNHAIALTAQIEGAVAFGLTAALKSSITIRGGAVEQSNFHDYPLLRQRRDAGTSRLLFVPIRRVSGRRGRDRGRTRRPRSRQRRICRYRRNGLPPACPRSGVGFDRSGTANGADVRRRGVRARRVAYCCPTRLRR